MHAEEQAGAIGNGALVIAQARAIGGADFAEHGAAFVHDIGDAEAIADFDQLTARDDDFGAFRKRVENEKYGCGVVVDYDGRFGANQFGEQVSGVDVALAAFATRDIVLEIRVAGGGCVDLRKRGLRQRRAAEIGVQDYARSIDDAAERWRESGLDFDHDLSNDFGDDARFRLGRVEHFRIGSSSWRQLAFQARTEIGEHLADSFGNEAATRFFG